MKISLIVSLILAMSLYFLPMVTKAGITISFGTGNNYHGYSGYSRYEQCYYPCYNRYGQAYACYPRSGAACNMRPSYSYNPYSYSSNSYYYSNPGLRIWIGNSHKRWDRSHQGYKRSYYHRY